MQVPAASGVQLLNEDSLGLRQAAQDTDAAGGMRLALPAGG